MKILKFFIKLFRFSLALIKDITHEFVYLRNHNNEVKHSTEDNRFIEINQTYWSESTSDAKGIILIEGFFTTAGNNYVLRTGMLAKAIQSKTKQKIFALIDKPAFKSGAATAKYASFGIEGFIYLRASVARMVAYLKAAFAAMWHYSCIQSPEDILKIAHHNILLGDLIYDDYIKWSQKTYTILKKKPALFKAIHRAFFYYFTYAKICQQYAVKYLVCTHIVYSQYGILARVALRYGADVIETNDLTTNHIPFTLYQNKLVNPNYHSIMQYYFKDVLQQEEDKKAAYIAFAEQNLHERLSGQIKQYDARLAYKDKEFINKEDLKKRLNIANDNPFVIIFSHIFADAPHCSHGTLFQDYYDWLCKTIQHALKVEEVNWLIKPHPSAKLYGEEGIVESLIEQYGRNKEEKNIFVYPKDCSTKNLHEIVQAMITVNGTAGIEFGCFGVPVIITGRAFYSHAGFTTFPKNQEEYYDCMSNIRTIPKLTPQQVQQAKILYGAYMQSKMQASKIISSEALDMIWWGEGEKIVPNIELGNQLINNQLLQYDPKHEAQYLQIIHTLS